MITMTLGRTGIRTNKNGFGALPIQRADMDTAKHILLKAYDNGITFFDTARAYSDSEEKLGIAFNGMRDKITIATKTMSTTVEGFWKDLETSLRLLKTDYVDIYQFHNPAFCPRPGDGTGLYEAMLEAREKGMLRFISITNHRLAVAKEAVESELYDTLQFPFSYLSGDAEIELVNLSKAHNIGFLAMKALAGGLINNASAAYESMLPYENVLPIWGIQREHELDDFIACQNGYVDENAKTVIENDRKELSGAFCRGCGYCMPCPVGIEINMCARMPQFIRRAPSAPQLSEVGQARMLKIEKCLDCGKCKAKCPYGLDVPTLLKESLKDYKEILGGKAV
jgi:Predicted oxidoreductases of the aldo/keto reductase family